jgi:hypothetical protein
VLRTWRPGWRSSAAGWVFGIDLEVSLREAREALASVASGHTRGKIVLQVGQ